MEMGVRNCFLPCHNRHKLGSQFRPVDLPGAQKKRATTAVQLPGAVQ